MIENQAPTASPNLSAPQFSTQQVCATCKFWQEQRCHRYPPVLTHTESEMGIEIAQFPHTGPGYWCGEYAFQTRVQGPLVVKQTYNLP